MASSNAAGITVPPGAVADLETLLEHLDRVGEAIERSKAVADGVTAFQVLRPISEAMGIGYTELYDAFTALENLRLLEIEFGSPKEAILRVESGVDSAFSPRIVEREQELLELLSAYSKQNPIATSFKAQRLAYLYEHVYRDAEVITDSRPIFDSTGEVILEFIVSHNLSITYSSAASPRAERIHLAMDAADVLKLRNACDRAIVKARTLKSALAHAGKWEIHLLRDNEDGP